MDRFTGGSFENMSILALNITPYITSSIIIQLLTIAIPKFEEWQKDGEDGRKKLTALTRYITIALALIESIAMAIGFYRNTGFLTEQNPFLVVQIVAALTAGSAFLMWVGERITENGVGNGISIVLTINILSRMPSDISSLFEQFVLGKHQHVVEQLLHVVHLMGRDDDEAVVIHVAGNDLAELALRRDVQSVGRFVHEEILGLRGQGEGHVRLLLLPHGEPAEVHVGTQFEVSKARLQHFMRETGVERAVEPDILRQRKGRQLKLLWQKVDFAERFGLSPAGFDPVATN